MTPPEFEPMCKIARLNRNCTVTEKLDGTNASVKVYIREDGNWDLIAGCRNHWLSPEKGKDNYGFAAWCEENKKALLTLGHGHHFGEWWGKGIQRGYGLAEKRFSLFNTGRWGIDKPPECCSVVPVLWEGPFSTGMVNMLVMELKQQGSRAAPGFMRPEGVVVHHSGKVRENLFKVTCENDHLAKSGGKDA